MPYNHAYKAAYDDEHRFGGRRAVTLASAHGRCADCENPAALVHHIDENRANQAPENLKPLCRACHARIHTTKRMALMPAEKRRVWAENGRRAITPEIAHQRSLTREARKRQRVGSRWEDLICPICGAAFRALISLHRTYCSHRCAASHQWAARRSQ